MPFLEWNCDFALGVDALDFHRIAYIDSLNDFYEMVMKSPSQTDAGPLLRRLNEETQAYHCAEEKILESIHYSELAQHCKRHRYFAGKIRDFEARHACGDCAALVQMPRFLLEWLYKHMLQEDLLYRHCLSALPVGEAILNRESRKVSRGILPD